MRDSTTRFERMHRTNRHRQSPRRLLGAFALTALVASACGPNPSPPLMQAQLESRVSVLNKSREMHVLRVRDLRPEVQLDCERVAQSPAEHLPDDAFGAPTRWPLYSDQELGLGIDNTNPWGSTDDLGGRQCNASLIQSDTISDIVVFWDASLEPKSFQFDPDIPEHIKPDPQTVVLRGDYSAVDPSEMKPYRFRPCGEARMCGAAGEAEAAEIPSGARYYWETTFERPLNFERAWQPDERPQQVTPECEMPGAGASLVWEQPFGGEWVVTGLDEGIDGCHALTLEARQDPEHRQEYLICAPMEALAAIAPRDEKEVVIELRSTSDRDFEGLHIGAEHFSPEGYIDDSAELYLSRGTALPSVLGVNARTEIRSGCAPVEAACGQLDIPADLRLTESGAEPELLSPGESAPLDQGSRQIHLVRAFERPVVDAACAEDGVSAQLAGEPGSYIEAVSVIRY